MFLIVSGGAQPEDVFIKALAKDARMIIAADKGAQYCLESGITPDLAVGDMDSVQPDYLEALEEMGVEILRFDAHKDRTDTAIALEEALKRGANEVRIIAGLGDRFDHCLANVHLLLKALQSDVKASIVTDRELIFLIDSDHEITSKKGRTISFLPLTSHVGGLCLEGFEYELTNASMDIGDPYGVSNIITKDISRIKVDKGIIIAVLSP